MFIFIFIFVLDFGLDFFFLLFFIFLLPSGFRGSAASGPHNPTTHYYPHYLHHQRPGPMASVPNGGPPPPPAAATPCAAATPAAAAAAAPAAAATTPAIDLSSEESKDNAPDVQSRFDIEMAEYMKTVINGNGFDLLSFWDDAARPRCDSSNTVYEMAKFPILLARVYHSADSSSCQSERDFSALTFILNDLRGSMREDYIGMMMLLNLNQNIIPEMSSFNNSHAEKKNVRAKALTLAAKAQATGAGDVVEVF